MALPFYLPGVDAAETELNYRRLERLLRDLYHVLHALIAGGAPLHGGRAANQPPPPPPPAAGSASTAAPGGQQAGTSSFVVLTPSTPARTQQDPRVTAAPPSELSAPRLPSKPAAPANILPANIVPASTTAVGIKPPPGSRAARLTGGRISLQFELAGTTISIVST